MEQQKTNTENKSEKKNKSEKRQLTPQEIQKRKKLIIFPLMILAFIISLWMIFAPTKREESIDTVGGFNADLPLPDKDEILSNKKQAYELDQSKSMHQERLRTLQDYGFDIEQKSVDNKISDNSHSNSPISTSTNSYREINRQLQNFYEEPPADDPEKDELFERVTELEMRLRESENIQSSTEEQLALLEKSYEFAAKYMNNQQQQNAVEQNITMTDAPLNKQAKSNAMPVKAVHETIVSGLEQPISDEAFMEAYSKPRNTHFHTAGSDTQSKIKNTIAACIHEDQVVMDGQNVRLRLLEPLQAGAAIIPKNTLLTGTARFQRERLDIEIISIEYNNSILSVELSVYDSDGQKGLSAPTTLEMQSLTEGAANIGSGLGSSFTINQNAGSAIVSDLTRGLLQGGSQYLSKKLRTARISLKANYQVMLLSK